MPDSLDAIALALASHHAMTGKIGDPPAWWVHHIVVDGVVVGDIGFHGPPGPERTVEIGYSVVPAWRGHGVASRACDLILQRAWQDGADIVIAETDHHNVASQAVLLRNGFRRGPDGVFTIKRLRFNIGEGVWKDTDVVADDVQIKFHIVVASTRPAGKK